MAASAERIDFVAHSARNIANQGGFSAVLTVDFRVFRKGPAHVAGMIYTRDFWATPLTAVGTFQRFEGDFEIWRAQASVAGNNVDFEYVIFCDDYRDAQNVRKIYNTNSGNTFQIASSF